MCRLSDEAETRLTRPWAPAAGRAERLGRTYLRLRGQENGCLLIAGFEGTDDDVTRRRGRFAEMLRAAGGVFLGERWGSAWHDGRFAAPYLRDELMDRGVMVETLETACPWSALANTHETVGTAIQAALAERGTPGLVMCHVSHLYPSGASLYFTFIAPQERGAELEQWRAAKTAAGDAIAAAGGAITHHHAVGRDHAPWMEAEVGAAGPGGAARRSRRAWTPRDHEPREAAAGRLRAPSYVALGVRGLRRLLLRRGLRRRLRVLGRRLELVELAAQHRVARVLAVLVDLLDRHVDELVALEVGRAAGRRPGRCRSGR